MKQEIDTVRKIIEEYFYDYVIFTNVDAIMAKASALNLSEAQLHDVFRLLRRNTGFFEKKLVVQYGLYNLFMYAVEAMYIPETKWDEKRADVTSEYKKLLLVQSFFTINLQ